MFAIVDIETTGGYGNQNCITEIAIVLFNGTEIEKTYHTLINPEAPINWYVQKMTGITDAMVAEAPKFSEVAQDIFQLLSDRIFIAHNVNFDYSFVRNHLNTCGYQIDLPKICTVRLARKIFPGLPKYGLGTLSKHFNIENMARHRAIGDATATTKLFEIILKNDKNNEVAKLIKRRKAAAYLPPNLQNTEVVDRLPSLPGVYYFHNKKDKIVYVGKAVNLKKRVTSHFSNNKSSKQKQDFLKEIYNITWKICSSNFTAEVFESIEIKRLWPQFNKSQKYYERRYGIFVFEDSLGYKRLAIDNKKKVLQPIQNFGLLVEARQYLQALCNEYDIHPYMFFLSKIVPEKLEDVKKHNQLIHKILVQQKDLKQTYLVHDGTQHYILIEHGSFWGMGEVKGQGVLNLLRQLAEAENNVKKQNNLKPRINKAIKFELERYSENWVVMSCISQYIQQNPESVIML